MAIKIVNGQAVVVSDKTTSPSIPKPTSQNQPFTQQDPKIIMQSLMGFIPGLQGTIEDIKKGQIPTVGKSLGYGAADIARGIAGLPVRLGLSISDFFWRSQASQRSSYWSTNFISTNRKRSSSIRSRTSCIKGITNHTRIRRSIVGKEWIKSNKR